MKGNSFDGVVSKNFETIPNTIPKSKIVMEEKTFLLNGICLFTRLILFKNDILRLLDFIFGSIIH